MMYVVLYVIKEQLLAYGINYLLSHNQQRHCWPVRIPLPSAVKRQIHCVQKKTPTHVFFHISMS